MIQTIKNFLHGIKLDDLPAISGIAASAGELRVVRSLVESADEYWLVDKKQYDTRLDDFAARETHYFKYGIPLGELMPPKDFQRFLPLVEAVEAKLGYRIINVAPR